jgi:signal transduction histidine kinase
MADTTTRDVPRQGPAPGASPSADSSTIQPAAGSAPRLLERESETRPSAGEDAGVAATEAAPALGAALARPWATGANVLEPRDRLDLERVLLWLRLSFLVAAVLPLLAFGMVAAPYALLIGATVLCSYGVIWLLVRRFPALVLRYQLALRLLDCGLVYLILSNYHAFIGNAYYDAFYVFFVVAAAATNGRRGALVTALAAALLIACGRLNLIASGVVAFELRHVTDSLFYLLFFCATGAAVAVLMRKSGEVVLRRERIWRAELAGHNAVLEKTAAQLAVANRELEAFSYSVSHDLRAPLRSIDGFSQALLEDYGPHLDAAGQDMLRRVRAGSQRMAQLIDDLLDLSRVTRSELRRELVDLTALARDVAADLRLAQPDRQVEFVVAAGLLAHGDSHLLRLLLENLLGNAWKFTGKHPRARVEFGMIGDGEQRRYFVRDDGAGFDMAYVNKLFGTFQRLHPASEFAGTGIGLATVQRIVHRHGGRVWAEGAVEQGATFYFTLA